MTDQTNDASAGDRLDRVIADYMQRIDSGEAVDREQFIAEHPDVADALREFFETSEAVEDMARPVAPGGDLPIDRDSATLPPSSLVGGQPDSSDSTPELSSSGPQRSTRLRYFGDYELLEEIARGGMGVVYRARQVSLNRIVAVKMILAGQLAGPDDVRRFHTEAEAAAQLQHPNIVAIHEVGEHEGQQYFSMDYVEGTSLAALVRENPLPAKQAAAIVKTVAEAIHYAHSKGILHRDLKPNNVLLSLECGDLSPLSDRGDLSPQSDAPPSEPATSRRKTKAATSRRTPKITDFGLAKRIEGGSELTGTGQILGTPSYMPPEQAGAKRGEIGPGSDVYSLGAILYELLTGRPPFRAETPLDTLLQVLDSEPVQPRLLNPNIDSDLETITLKCLEKESSRRYHSAESLAQDIERWMNHEPIKARPSTTWERSLKWAKRRPAVAALAAAVLVTLVSGTGFSTFFAFTARVRARDALAEKTRANENADRADLKAAEALANAERERKEKDRADANAKEIVRALYSAHMNLAQMNWETGNLRAVNDLLRRYAEEGPSRLIGRDVRGWEWWFQSRLLHGYLRHLQDPATSECIVYHPDGRRAAAGGNGGLSLWDVVTGTKLWSAAAPQVRGLAFDAKGDRIATCGERQMIVWDTATGKQLVEARNDNARSFAIAFHPFGKCVATACADAIHIWDSGSGQLLQALGEKQAQGFYAVDFSPDAKHLAGGGFNGRVFIWSVNDGFQLISSLKCKEVVECLTFSPDGQQLAIATNSAVILLAATDWKQIKHFDGYAKSIAFSPDGGQLAAASSGNHIRVWDLKTGTETRDFSAHIRNVWDIAWSPNGQRLASVGLDYDGVKIWDQLDDRVPLQLRHGYSISELAFSEDGTRIATAGRDAIVRVWDAVTGRPLRRFVGLTGWGNVATKLAFSRDGRKLALCGTYGIKFCDVDAGKVLWQNDEKFAALDVALDPTEELLGSAGRDGVLRLWRASDGHLMEELQGEHRSPADALLCLDFHPDGQRLASMDSRGSVVLWRLPSGQVERRWTVRLQDTQDRAIDFSPDGRLLAVPAESSIAIFDAQTGKQVISLVGHEAVVTGLAFDPSGTRLASAAENIKIWDIPSGHELRTLKGIGAVAFSSDGLRLAGGGAEAASIWDARPLQGEVLVEREALGLMKFLFAKPLAKADVVESIRGDQTISEPVRRKALELAEPFTQD